MKILLLAYCSSLGLAISYAYRWFFILSGVFQQNKKGLLCLVLRVERIIAPFDHHGRWQSPIIPGPHKGEETQALPSAMMVKGGHEREV